MQPIPRALPRKHSLWGSYLFCQIQTYFTNFHKFIDKSSILWYNKLIYYFSKEDNP